MANIRPPSSVLRPPSSFTIEVDKVTEPEWNSLLEQFSDACIYQTWAYGAVLWGEDQLSHVVLKLDGQAVAVAQLRLVRLPVIRRGVAYLRWGPVCTRTGTSWNETIFREMLHALVDEFVKRRRLLLRILPRTFVQDLDCDRMREIYDKLAFGQDEDVKPYHTIRLDLGPPLEQLRKQLDQKWRNQLNGAERNNLEIIEGTGDNLYEQFLQLYDEMMARKQFDTSVDVHQFRRIQQRLPEHQKMWIIICRKDSRPMTAFVGSVVGDMGIYLLGATSNDGMKTKGSYLQQWRFIQHLKERGCRSYDLGGINPESNPGVYHFKQGLGGDEMTALGRFSMADDFLSAASVTGVERLRRFVDQLRH